RDEIERRNQPTVLELLRTVPGLAMAQNGGPGKTASVFIRGGNSSHTLVLIDGVRVNNNTTGALDFADLTAVNVEKIEIIRGPQGVLHGSEAVSGVVSITTRRGAGDASGWVRASAGTEDYTRFAAGVRGGNERFDYSIGAARVDTDGVSAASEANGNTEADPWENFTVNGQLGGAFWGDGRVDLTLRYTDAETGIDGFVFGIGPADDLNALQTRELFSGALTVSKPVTDRWTQTLGVSSATEDLAGIDPDNPFGNFTIESETLSVVTQADIEINAGNAISLGYRTEERDAVSSFDESLDIDSLFGEYRWSPSERVNVSVGVRNDDHTFFGDETTYRLSLSARLSEAARLHGSFGTGFKAPTLSELFFPSFGNLDLDPETSEAFDLGVELRFADGDAVLDVTYFDTEFEDLILFTFPAGFVNVAEATSEGVELSLDWAINDAVKLRASHTYNDTEDLSTGLQLARRPEQRTTFGLDVDIDERWSGALIGIAVNDRIDSTTEEMDDYVRFDLSVAYQATERLRPFVRIENLFDEDYSEIPGFTSPGFTAVGGLHVDF
ncbi:MAG: TonB-dependent receptor, partial [Acidobacteriota bacterium]